MLFSFFFLQCKNCLYFLHCLLVFRLYETECENGEKSLFKNARKTLLNIYLLKPINSKRFFLETNLKIFFKEDAIIQKFRRITFRGNQTLRTVIFPWFWFSLSFFNIYIFLTSYPFLWEVRQLRHPILIDCRGSNDEAKVRTVTSWEKQMVRADELLRNKDSCQ